MYGIFHPVIPEYTCFSNAHGLFSGTNHNLGCKTSLNKFKKPEITQSIFSNHNGMTLKNNDKIKYGKSTNMWKLNNTLLNNQMVKEEITRDIRKHL